MIYVPKVAGFGTKDLARRNDKKYFKQTAKQVSSLDRLSERRVFRDALAEKASDKKGINVNEMADIVTAERYNRNDHINKQEARVVAEYFGISKRRLLKAKRRYLAHSQESEERKNTIAKPHGQQDDDVLGRGFESNDRGASPQSLSAQIPRRPMF